MNPWSQTPPWIFIRKPEGVAGDELKRVIADTTPIYYGRKLRDKKSEE